MHSVSFRVPKNISVPEKIVIYRIILRFVYVSKKKCKKVLAKKLSRKSTSSDCIGCITARKEGLAGLRKHVVNCRVEGDIAEAKKKVNQVTGKFYVEALEHTLEQSGWTKDMQVEFIDKIIDFVEKNREGTCQVK